MPATLQKLMRHKSITTTLDYYAEVQAESVGDELRRKEVPTKSKSNTFGNIGHSEAKASKEESHQNTSFNGSLQSGRQDSNLRPFDPQSNALPDCATARVLLYLTC
jgi:hypothetical protein